MTISLFLDGGYAFSAGRKPVFLPVPSPTDEDAAEVAAGVFSRVARKLDAGEPAAEQRAFMDSAPLLVALAEASARGVIATGPRRGCRVVRVRGVTADVDAFVMGRLCAQVEGYNLQAATRIAANDRDALERMGRYRAGTSRSSTEASMRACCDRRAVAAPEILMVTSSHYPDPRRRSRQGNARG